MTAAGFFLLGVLTLCDKAASVKSIDCDRCNQEGRWWPLFKPSQLLSSEFPEHSKYKRSHDPASYSTYEHSSPNHRNGISSLVGFGNSKVGLNTPIRHYNTGGRRTAEWDHVSYGDINGLERVGSESAEDRDLYGRLGGNGSPERKENSGISGEIATDNGAGLLGSRDIAKVSGEMGRNSGEVIKFGKDDVMSSAEVERIIKEGATVSSEETEGVNREEPKFEQKVDDTSEQDRSTSSQTGNFFNDGSFFDESPTSSVDRIPGDFEISKEFSLSNEANDGTSSNSIELPSTNSYSANSFRSHKPIATSYSAMTSTFGRIRPVQPRMRNLLHPDIAFNDASMYVNSPASVTFFNGMPHTENPEILRVDHIPPPQSFAPWALPKAGVPHHLPFSRTALRWQNVQSRGPPFNRVVHHESKIHHVIPTRDPLADFNWSETRKVEQRKPSPFSKTLYFFKKKPVEYKKAISRRQGHNNVYFVKSNKRLS